MKYYKTLKIIPLLGIGYYKETSAHSEDSIVIHNFIFICFKLSIYC